MVPPSEAGRGACCGLSGLGVPRPLEEPLSQAVTGCSLCPRKDEAELGSGQRCRLASS